MQSGTVSGQPHRLVLHLRCTVPASREQVFRLFTEPSELTRWWGPAGFTLAEIEIDFRVGGGYRFGMQPPEGDLFHLGGEFVEIAPPTRLAYTFRYDEPDPDDQDTVVRLAFADVNGSTEITLVHEEFATEARLALHREGWS